MKVIGEIGVSSCRPPLANLSNEVLTRNRNSAALAREVGDRHPLMIAKFVKDSVVFFCSRKSEELLEGFLDQHVIPRFLAELLMFPVDHVLVALGRYRVVGVGGRDLTFVESIADSMASENGKRRRRGRANERIEKTPFVFLFFFIQANVKANFWSAKNQWHSARKQCFGVNRQQWSVKADSQSVNASSQSVSANSQHVSADSQNRRTDSQHRRVDSKAGEREDSENVRARALDTERANELIE